MFCAGVLLGMELPPPPGYHVEVGFAYATAARRYEIDPGREDISDVTPKFVLIGIGARGYRRPGSAPARRRQNGACASRSAHPTTSRSRRRLAVTNTSATGTGRYENFAVLGATRSPRGTRSSSLWDRRTHKADRRAQRSARSASSFPRQRLLSAERVDVGLGLAASLAGIRSGLSARYVRPSGSNATGGAFHISEGAIYGGALEVRGARADAGPSRLPPSGRAARSVSTRRAGRTSCRAIPTRSATLEAYRLGVGYAAGRTEVFLQATYDRSRLRFVVVRRPRHGSHGLRSAAITPNRASTSSSGT